MIIDLTQPTMVAIYPMRAIEEMARMIRKDTSNTITVSETRLGVGIFESLHNGVRNHQSFIEIRACDGEHMGYIKAQDKPLIPVRERP